MAFDLGGLTAYVEENKADLIQKPITGSRTLSLIDVRTVIKSGEKIPILESTAPAQAGSGCGFTSSGTTTITQTTLNTTAITVQEALCLNTMEAYYTQKYLPNGSRPESSEIDAEVANRKVANIAKKVEQMIWQGKTTYTNDTYLKQMNGFIAQIDTAGTAIAATPQASISTSTVRGIFEDIIYAKLPAAVLDKSPVVFCGQDTFRILALKLFQDNLYHVAPSASDFDAMQMVYPGTNVKVIAVAGLNADNGVDGGGSLPTAVKNRIFAGALSNFVAGVDVQTDQSEMKMWYSQDNMDLRFHCRFRIGVVNHFIDQIVQYTNS